VYQNDSNSHLITDLNTFKPTLYNIGIPFDMRFIKHFDMSYFRKKLERRTFSQDRYYILIKRQKEGKATFSELTELDEIVNRVPDIRDLVIREDFGGEDIEADNPTNGPTNEHLTSTSIVRHPNLLTRIKNWLNRNFIDEVSVDDKNLTLAPVQA
jgi:hypothetical protein